MKGSKFLFALEKKRHHLQWIFFVFLLCELKQVQIIFAKKAIKMCLETTSALDWEGAYHSLCLQVNVEMPGEDKIICGLPEYRRAPMRFWLHLKTPHKHI